MKKNAQAYFLMLGVVANALWATAFIIPHGLSYFSSEVITISRYVVYGVISIVVFLLSSTSADQMSWRVFCFANLISFGGNVGYYYFLTTSIQKIGFLVPALIVGMLPVSVILISCVQYGKMRVSGLLPGIAVMVCGIVLVNWATLRGGALQLSQGDYLLGVGASLVALAFLTFYFLLNVRFLKMNPCMSSIQWTSLLGICSLLHSLIFAGVKYCWGDGRELLGLFQAPADRLVALAFGAFFLGVFVSYLAVWAWNISSRHISEVMGGRILCLEAVFALVYGYWVDSRLPNLPEVSGAVLMIAGGYFVQRQEEQQKRQDEMIQVSKS